MSIESRKTRDATSTVVDVCDTLVEIVLTTIDEFATDTRTQWVR